MTPVLAALALADPPGRWQALGFAVGDDGRVALGGVELVLGGSGHGITGWEVRDAPGLDGALGLLPAPAEATARPEQVPAVRAPTPAVRAQTPAVRAQVPAMRAQTPAVPAQTPAQHRNGATGLDHVVVLVPDFAATATRLEQIGLPFRCVRQASETVRQGFRRLGPAILEVVEAPGAAAPAFWGLVVIVPDLGALATLAAPHVKSPRPAVQPGRQIAPVSRSAGLTTRLAFMDPEPRTPA